MQVMVLSTVLGSNIDEFFFALGQVWAGKPAERSSGSAGPGGRGGGGGEQAPEERAQLQIQLGYW